MQRPPTRRQIAAKVADQVIPALNTQIANLDSVKAELDVLAVRVAVLEAEGKRSLWDRLRGRLA